MVIKSKLVVYWKNIDSLPMKANAKTICIIVGGVTISCVGLYFLIKHLTKSESVIPPQPSNPPSDDPNEPLMSEHEFHGSRAPSMRGLNRGIPAEEGNRSELGVTRVGAPNISEPELTEEEHQQSEAELTLVGEPNQLDPKVSQVGEPKPLSPKVTKIEEPKPPAQNLSQVDASKPPAQNLSQVDASKSPAQNLSQVDASKPPAQNLSQVDASKSPAQNLSQVDASKPPAQNLSQVDASKSPAQNLSQVGTSKPPVQNLSQVDASKSPAQNLSQVGTSKPVTSPPAGSSGVENVASMKPQQKNVNNSSPRQTASEASATTPQHQKRPESGETKMSEKSKNTTSGNLPASKSEVVTANPGEKNETDKPPGTTLIGAKEAVLDIKKTTCDVVDVTNEAGINKNIPLKRIPEDGGTMTSSWDFVETGSLEETAGTESVESTTWIEEVITRTTIEPAVGSINTPSGRSTVVDKEVIKSTGTNPNETVISSSVDPQVVIKEVTRETIIEPVAGKTKSSSVDPEVVIKEVKKETIIEQAKGETIQSVEPGEPLPILRDIKRSVSCVQPTVRSAAKNSASFSGSNITKSQQPEGGKPIIGVKPTQTSVQSARELPEKLGAKVATSKVKSTEVVNPSNKSGASSENIGAKSPISMISTGKSAATANTESKATSLKPQQSFSLGKTDPKQTPASGLKRSASIAERSSVFENKPKVGVQQAAASKKKPLDKF